MPADGTTTAEAGKFSPSVQLVGPLECRKLQGALVFSLVIPSPAGLRTAPSLEKGKKNAVSRATGVQDGKKVFETNCSMCHGSAGIGDALAAAALNSKPKDLSAMTAQAQTDGELFGKISAGRSAMPSWQRLPEKDRWSVVHYRRGLGGKK